MKNTLLQNNSIPPTYEHESSETRHLFFKTDDIVLHIPSFHESHELIYVIHGKILAHIDDKTFSMSDGDICFVNKNQVHFYEKQTAEISVICLVLGYSYTHHFREQHKDSFLPNAMKDKTKNKKLIDILTTWLHSERTFLLNCAYANMLYDAILSTYGFAEIQEPQRKTQLAQQFIEYIHANYASPIDLTSMAKAFGYTKEYFSKLFNEVVGQHFLNVLNAVRLQHANELLAEFPQKSVAEVCDECGFNSVVTFYRYNKKFQKEREGAPPSKTSDPLFES